jgi:putative spermidine/putrescine transport system ATP-binding protein
MTVLEFGNPASLLLEGVTKRYEDRPAVSDVSLEVRPGEFVTLLGPSGSGKTTTLRIIAGFIVPDEGSVLLDDREVTRMPPHRRDVGMVFQNYALFPHMTAAENVAFPLRMRKTPSGEIEERVRQALELVQLGGLGGRSPSQLSGGQQQRVALARALVFGPRVLLMDEPLGALDKKLREALQLELMRIHRELGVTVVYVTHDQEEALVMSQRIAVVNEGRIEQVGTGEELYEEPASLFVADFVGESNIFEGILEEVSQGPRVTRHGLSIRVADEAPRRAGMRPGDQAALVIRPEWLTLWSVDQPVDEAGLAAVLTGVVREAIYLGSTFKYVIDLQDGASLVVRSASGDSSQANAGDRVRVGWDPARGVLVRHFSSVAKGESRKQPPPHEMATMRGE